MSTTTRRTSNPALSAWALGHARAEGGASDTMTLQGTVVKTLVLLAILTATAAYTWSQTLVALETGGFAVHPSAYGYILVGALAGLAVAVVTVFVPRIAPWTGPLYAALEGVVLGGFSAVLEVVYPDIVLQAVGLTLGTLFVLLAAYGTGLVKVTEGFKAGVLAATGAIFLVYLVNLVLLLFDTRVPFLHETGWIGIGISLFVVVIAALNLVLDFDRVTEGVQQGAPKYMEWYGGFGLLVTLVWLYIEVLHLLGKLRSSES